MDLKIHPEPKILFLEGCFPDDCASIEDLFDEKLLKSTYVNNEYDTELVMYDKIPPIFYDLDSWPTSNNIMCWSCSKHFTTRPLFVPTHITPSNDPSREYGSIGTRGNFCSWNCCADYIYLYFAKSKREKMEMLKFEHKIFTGKSIREIVRARPKTDRKEYGGDMTEKEYDEHLSTVNNDHLVSIDHNMIKHISRSMALTDTQLSEDLSGTFI